MRSSSGCRADRSQQQRDEIIRFVEILRHDVIGVADDRLEAFVPERLRQPANEIPQHQRVDRRAQRFARCVAETEQQVIAAAKDVDIVATDQASGLGASAQFQPLDLGYLDLQQRVLDPLRGDVVIRLGLLAGR